MSVRKAAVAGMFYPGSAKELKAVIDQMLARSDNASLRARTLIVPHAGYIYSGVVAAQAFALLRGQAYARVVLLGPAHRVALRGLALPSVDAFATPLGEIAIDRSAIAALPSWPWLQLRDDAHAQEHALEVQLPFLQRVLTPGWSLLPVVVGHCDAAVVASLLNEVVDEQTLLVISSDLSHYLRYEDAQRVDAQTCEAILHYSEQLQGEQACGAYALNGLACFAREKAWQIALLGHCNSGDTAGDKQRVVGYASFVLQ